MDYGDFVLLCSSYYSAYYYDTTNYSTQPSQEFTERMTSQQTNMAAKNENKITVMVVVICILFVVLTTPLTAFYIIVLNAGMLVYMGSEVELYEAVILILALSNHAVNFLLYAVSSSKFREEFKHMRRGMKLRRSRSKNEETSLTDVMPSTNQDTMELPSTNHI